MYNLRKIMLKAWAIFRKYAVSFSEALHRAWASEKAKAENAKRVNDAKAAAGVTEQAETWSGWREQGFEVLHGSKALFTAELLYCSKGDDCIYRASFFGRSQVQPIGA